MSSPTLLLTSSLKVNILDDLSAFGNQQSLVEVLGVLPVLGELFGAEALEDFLAMHFLKTGVDVGIFHLLVFVYIQGKLVR